MSGIGMPPEKNLDLIKSASKKLAQNAVVITSAVCVIFFLKQKLVFSIIVKVHTLIYIYQNNTIPYILQKILIY